MTTTSLQFSSPLLPGPRPSEAEVLGSAVWLWMHASPHRDAPLHTLSTLLLPAIKHGRWAMAVQAGRPVFYLAWADLDEAAEARYLRSSFSLQPDDWCRGDRTWVLDWVAPFGHSAQIRGWVTRQLFQGRCFRSLYHRGHQRGLRVMQMHGQGMQPLQARAWFEANPVVQLAERGN